MMTDFQLPAPNSVPYAPCLGLHAGCPVPHAFRSSVFRFASSVLRPRSSEPRAPCPKLHACRSMPHAHYEYGPFGEAIRATGPASRLNPFRWSTKLTDKESGLVYYGYRYYSPTLGRWINRDPAAEKYDLHLYSYCRNLPVSALDVLALATEEWVKTAVNEFLRSIGSSSRWEDLQPVREEALGWGVWRKDPATGRVLRIDLKDAGHGATPNIHVYLNLKDARRGKASGRQFFERGTGRLLPVATIAFGIGSVMALEAAVTSGLYQQALAAAAAGDLPEAKEKLFELSVEMSIESGSMIPFYAINAYLAYFGPHDGPGGEER
jgi:RHS repeat-associated protein